jgi:N-methylhydantoinase B
VRRATNVKEQFSSGIMPESLDELAGKEEHLGFRDHAIALGGNDVWEYCSPTTAGYGDPLTRNPDEVVRDVSGGLLSETAASEVYGVVLDKHGYDNGRTMEKRKELMAARLNIGEMTK